MKGYFVTGSDTGVGKTFIGCQLVSQLRHSELSVKVRKPVESGCEPGADGQLVGRDGESLYVANGRRESLDIVNPYRFQAALAPDRAARLADHRLSLAQLEQAARNQVNEDDRVLVEGAGGFCSPIAEDALNADLACWLGLPVIIVVDDRLGAINQALMTIGAVTARTLTVAAVILNQRQQPSGDGDERQMDNLDDLRRHSQLPVYACNHHGQLPPVKLL